MSRKLRKACIAVCNIGDTDFILNENITVEGLMTSDSFINDVHIPFHRNMTESK